MRAAAHAPLARHLTPPAPTGRTGTPTDRTGTLRTEQVYLTLHEPVLLSARNERGQQYLISYAEPTPTGDAWLITPVSAARLARFERREIDIREMFQHPESGVVFHTTFNDPGSVGVTRPLRAGDPALLEHLYESGVYLSPGWTAAPSAGRVTP